MSQPNLIIFMGTYNGERHLPEQLDSFCSQTEKNWQLWVSDDGSSDNTCQVLRQYQDRLGEQTLSILSGPRKGFAANFLSLICNPLAESPYYAYSDQDDIWEPNKLQRAIDWLSTISSDTPALYCTRTILIDENGKELGYSPLYKKNPSFRNAIIQNIGGGNTMVFNHAAIKLLRDAGEKIDIVAHDWWTYILVIGAGGKVYYDAQPTLRYRQHPTNLMGTNIGWQACVNRATKLLKGLFHHWMDINIKALLANQQLLTNDNKTILNTFISARQSKWIVKLIKIKQLGLYRQTFLGNIGLVVATVFNKL